MTSIDNDYAKSDSRRRWETAAGKPSNLNYGSAGDQGVDDNNRQTSANYADGNLVTTTYTATGQVDTVTDDRGNTLTKYDGFTHTSYAYDSRNRLTDLNAGQETYQYDAQGIRQSETQDGQTTHYLTDPNRDYAQVIEESFDLNAIAEVKYTYGDDLVHQHRQIDAISTDSSTYHYDGIGSTRLLTDTASDITDSYAYTVFWESESQTGVTQNDYLYTGEQYDSSLDNYYLRARYYDQGVGRFTQMDSWMGNPRDPITLHKYLYANVDPVNMVDPSGNVGIGSIVSFGLNLNTSTFVRFASSKAAKSGLQKFLLGRPPKDLGLVGELILEFAVQSVVDTMLFEGDSFKNKGAVGTSAHQGLKNRVQGFKPLPGFRVIAEPFFPMGSTGSFGKNNPTGSLGVDVLIQHRFRGKWKNVLGLDLKIGKGWSRQRVIDRKKRIGADVVQIRIEVSPK